MAALQGLTHDLRVADAFEGVIRPAVGELDDVVHDIFDVLGIQKCVIPNFRAISSRAGFRSTPMILSAPTILAA